jgi:hypothetical protein
LKETDIFIVLEMVDLGGHPVAAFIDKERAEAFTDASNENACQRKKRSLMKYCSYSEDQADAWVSCWRPYDMYESTLYE